MAMVLHHDLREFLFSLRRADVRFVVIGAYVLATLGRPRYSDDLDILVEASAANAERLARALREYGGFEELAAAVPEHMGVADPMFSIGKPPLAIDVTTGIDGVSFEEAWAGRREIVIDGQPIPFLGKDEYVRTKRAAGRPKDLADLALLEEASLLDDD
jgi:predicted nucleotidyltransferase